jgi:ABC-2 type transport system permease protein
MSTSTDRIGQKQYAEGHRWVVADTWSSFKRWMKKNLRNPFVVVVTLVQPVVWLLLFTQVFKSIARLPGFENGSYLAFFAPAVVIQIALFAATSSGINLVFDMREGVFNKLLASPTHRTAMFVGKTLAEAVVTSVQVVIVLVLALVLGTTVATGLLGGLGIIAISLLFSLGFAAFSNIIALITQNEDATILIPNLISLPLLFVSTAFLPETLLPEWVLTVSAINPVTYGVDAVRVLMLDGWVWSVLGPSVLGIVVFDLVFGVIAVVLMRRATDATPR